MPPPRKKRVCLELLHIVRAEEEFDLTARVCAKVSSGMIIAAVGKVRFIAAFISNIINPLLTAFGFVSVGVSVVLGFSLGERVRPEASVEGRG